ncbi:pyridoxal phosphate-dependent aminotransferase [Actinacidiphila yeochonensis]|uniref:pyridoxal phosphate-dependent aminotransferase n=1 Tax=Actinacidiphila yeochonensis TaxID=89050 RepID=UPI0005695D18|nr:pyridoxal phosphate-dependent aminotransferase [Actinacidiphila yeochonensis]
MNALATLLETGVRPNRLPDTAWLEAFLARPDRPGEPILLGLGEVWGRTPAALVDALGAAPDAAHGYQLSMYGLPRLRSVLRGYIRDTHRIGTFEGAFEVAVSWTGTRLAMRDYAELLRDSGYRDRPLAVVAGPSWDYAGVLEPLGFRMAYLDVSRDGRWEPTAASVDAFASGLSESPGLVVLNAQHNPTGRSWSREAVRALVALAAEHRAAILVDDAYYGFDDPGEEPVSSVREILARPDAQDLTWLAVRSLGKQFNCNGWALGALTGPPPLLDTLVNRYRARHSFNTGGVLQDAMARWLEDRPAVEEYLRTERAAYRVRRRTVIDRLAGAGVPSDAVISGPAGPYVLLPVPDAFRSGSRADYLERCAVRAGVLMSDAWPADRPLRPGARGGHHVRMFIGREPATLAEACDRLRSAGLLAGGDSDGRG